MRDTSKLPPQKGKQAPVTIVIEREFVGTKSVAETFIPIIFEDMRRETEQIRTFGNGRDSA